MTIAERFKRDPLAFIVAVCALAGPPISYGLAVQTDRATTQIRITDHQKQLDTLANGQAAIIDALAAIRADCAYIRGRLDATTMPTGPTPPAP